MNKLKIKPSIFLSLFFLASITIIIGAWYIYRFIYPRTVKIGILQSLTGRHANEEIPVKDATMLAVEEINAKGGVFGFKIEAIIVDPKSDVPTFGRLAEELITKNKVAVIFGGWSSASRKAIKTVVEKYNNLLFYPVQNEGLEDSLNIVYTSTTPNQQSLPGTTWCLYNIGKRCFIVGIDELFSRASNEIIKDVIALHDGQVVGEAYLAPNNIPDIVQQIVKAQPNVILNTIDGPENLTFFTELRKEGITPEKIPTMSFSLDEPDLQRYGAEYMAGNYSTWSHFQSIERLENKIFVANIKKRYGKDVIISDAMEAAYYGVYMWKQAVERAQSFDINKVRPELKNQAFDAPEGILYVDDSSLHTWSNSSIGKIRLDKQCTIVWNAQKSIRPIIYPFTRTPEEWNALLERWYHEWGDKWAD